MNEFFKVVRNKREKKLREQITDKSACLMVKR